MDRRADAVEGAGEPRQRQAVGLEPGVEAARLCFLQSLGPYRPRRCLRKLPWPRRQDAPARSEEHTSELQSLMRISYAVFCLKKKNNIKIKTKQNPNNKYTK